MALFLPVGPRQAFRTRYSSSVSRACTSGPSRGSGPGQLPGPPAAGRGRSPEGRAHGGRRMGERAPPLLDGNQAVEEKGIKNNLARVVVRPADQENGGDVIPPLNPPLWMAGRF